jgi:hypothetical protein
MKLLALMTLVIAGAALAACGTTRENRFNETAYADHNEPSKVYEHEVIYRTPAYSGPDVVYVQPAYRVVPATPAPVIYRDGYYYYR